MAVRCCVSCKYPPLILSSSQASLYLSLDFAVFGFNLLFWAFWSNQRQRHQNDNGNVIKPPTTTKWRQDWTSIPQNRDQPISGSTRSPTLCRHLWSLHLPRACHLVHLNRRHQRHQLIRHHGKFPRQFLPAAFFVYKYKTSAFVTGKCHKCMCIEKLSCKNTLIWKNSWNYLD